MPYKIRVRNTTTTPNHNIEIPDVTREQAGVMSPGDKAKLDAIVTGIFTADPVSGAGTAESPLTVEDNALDGGKILKHAVSGAFASRTIFGRDGSGSIALVDVPAGSQIIAALYFDEKTRQLDNGVGKFFTGIVELPNVLTQTTEADLKSVRFVLIVLRNSTPSEE